ncbi:hypothetical protein [Rhizobium sullae]|nr:hypothetical protein [Rhizobium sullae]
MLRWVIVTGWRNASAMISPDLRERSLVKIAARGLDLTTAGNLRLAEKVEVASMRTRPDQLDENILTLFNRACRQSRWEVAEHLLRALEASSDEGDGCEPPCVRSPLTDAYLSIASLHSKQ